MEYHLQAIDELSIPDDNSVDNVDLVDTGISTVISNNNNYCISECIYCQLYPAVSLFCVSCSAPQKHSSLLVTWTAMYSF